VQQYSTGKTVLTGSAGRTGTKCCPMVYRQRASGQVTVLGPSRSSSWACLDTACSNSFLFVGECQEGCQSLFPLDFAPGNGHCDALQEAVLFGEPGNKTLVKLRPYNDMVPLGWYTYKICWMRRPEDLHPQVRGD